MCCLNGKARCCMVHRGIGDYAKQRDQVSPDELLDLADIAKKLRSEIEEDEHETDPRQRSLKRYHKHRAG